jgi:hypothetical protein
MEELDRRLDEYRPLFRPQYQDISADAIVAMSAASMAKLGARIASYHHAAQIPDYDYRPRRARG